LFVLFSFLHNHEERLKLPLIQLKSSFSFEYSIIHGADSFCFSKLLNKGEGLLLPFQNPSNDGDRIVLPFETPQTVGTEIVLLKF
jgi:hypothetical protein